MGNGLSHNVGAPIMDPMQMAMMQGGGMMGGMMPGMMGMGGMMPGMMGGMMPGMMGSGMYGPLQGFGQPTFPGGQYPGNPWANGPLVPFMPFSETSQIYGFRIIAAVGTVWGAYDSPPRNVDQPFSAQMSAAVKKAALAELQREAAAMGASGLINVQFTIRENSVGGDQLVIHAEVVATAVRLMPN